MRARSDVAPIASGICQDLGYKSISYQLELIGKISILVLSIPILQSLLDTIDTVV
ncbi:MAG: stage III sporulation AC/AD family protein [Eubacterium sp.]|nr:stage III sporulation AC/AD family protein [Eubacterium sp.]